MTVIADVAYGHGDTCDAYPISCNVGAGVNPIPYRGFLYVSQTLF